MKRLVILSEGGIYATHWDNYIINVYNRKEYGGTQDEELNKADKQQRLEDLKQKYWRNECRNSTIGRLIGNSALPLGW